VIMGHILRGQIIWSILQVVFLIRVYRSIVQVLFVGQVYELSLRVKVMGCDYKSCFMGRIGL